MDIQLSDLLTVGLLVVLEGLLSADNALVVAVMILGLPRVDTKEPSSTVSSAPSAFARSPHCWRST